IGISGRLWSPFTVSADYTRTFWSQGEIRNLFLLPPPTPERGLQPIRQFPELTYPSLNERKQFDTAQLRVGIEYVALRGPVRWPLRAGFFTDRQFFADGNGHV